MTEILRAATGQTAESEEVSGPSSYPTGGFSVRTNLGRVNRAMVNTDDASWEARLAGVGSAQASNTAVGELHIQAFSQSSAGEAPSGQDLSSVTFTYDAKRL